MNNNKEIIQIPIEDLIPNRSQPRIAFDQKALEDLAKSIKQHGIIQPLVVRKLGEKYEIIAGERRYKASQIAGLISVPAIVTEMDDETSAEVALVENVQREDLSAIEEARSYKNILDKSDMTQGDLAKKMGVSQSSVANKLRLLNLSDEVQRAVLDGKISERHARSLLAIEDFNKQNELLGRIIDERLTVRQLDTIIKDIVNPVDDDEMEDVPLVDIDQNLDKIKSEATDIGNYGGYDANEFLNSQETNTYEPPSNDINSGYRNRFFNVSLSHSAEPKVEAEAPKVPSNDGINFFDFVSSSSDDINNLANESELIPPTPTDTMVEEVLDVEDSPLNSDNIETLDDSSDSLLFDNLEVEDSQPLSLDEPASQEFSVPSSTKIQKIRDTINLIEVDSNTKIEEKDLGETYRFVIEVKKDS